MFFPDASVDRFLSSLILLFYHLLGNRLNCKLTIIYFLNSSCSASVRVGLIPCISHWSGQCELVCVQIYGTAWGFKKPHNPSAPSTLPNFETLKVEIKSRHLCWPCICYKEIFSSLSNSFSTTGAWEKVLNILSVCKLFLNIGDNICYFSFWVGVIRLVEDRGNLLLAWPVKETLLTLAWNYCSTPQIWVCLFQAVLVKAGSLLVCMHFGLGLLQTDVTEWKST